LRSAEVARLPVDSAAYNTIVLRRRFFELAILPIEDEEDGEPCNAQALPLESAKLILSSDGGYVEERGMDEAVKTEDGYWSFRFFDIHRGELYTAKLEWGSAARVLFADKSLDEYLQAPSGDDPFDPLFSPFDSAVYKDDDDTEDEQDAEEELDFDDPPGFVELTTARLDRF
jgi:hypothetical protein